MAVVTGGLTMLGPIGAGLWSFLSPLFRAAESPQVRVALLNQVPDDGRPHFFPVVADRQDAWTHYTEQKVGAVYLIRQPGDPLPTVFTAKCPHAGCSIGYSAEDQQFKCPCHTSAFKIDGCRVNGDQEVAPRDMDTLDVELRELKIADGNPVTEVWVKFDDFKTGKSSKILSE
jgi:menaquinol-cytochrome c reductase iron-sulfur subunit